MPARWRDAGLCGLLFDLSQWWFIREIEIREVSKAKILVRKASHRLAKKRSKQ